MGAEVGGSGGSSGSGSVSREIADEVTDLMLSGGLTVKDLKAELVAAGLSTTGRNSSMALARPTVRISSISRCMRLRKLLKSAWQYKKGRGILRKIPLEIRRQVSAAIVKDTKEKDAKDQKTATQVILAPSWFCPPSVALL